MLMTLRKTAAAQRAVQSGGATAMRSPVPYCEVITIGFIGFGHIGQMLAKLLQAFQVRVIFYDPYVTQQSIALSACEKTENLTDMIPQC